MFLKDVDMDLAQIHLDLRLISSRQLEPAMSQLAPFTSRMGRVWIA